MNMIYMAFQSKYLDAALIAFIYCQFLKSLFYPGDIEDLSHRKKYGFIITNPPYGERIGDKDLLPGLYRTIGERYKALDSWSMYLITGYEDAEKYIGRKADKNRKIYNGMLKTYFYQFMGPKPPRRKEA